MVRGYLQAGQVRDVIQNAFVPKRSEWLMPGGLLTKLENIH